MRRPYFVALLPILFPASLKAADRKHRPPTKSPTAKPGIAKPVPGGGSRPPRTRSAHSSQNLGQGKRSGQVEQVKDMAQRRMCRQRRSRRLRTRRKKPASRAGPEGCGQSDDFLREEAKHVALIDVLGEGRSDSRGLRQVLRRVEKQLGLSPGSRRARFGRPGSAAKPAAPQFVALVTDPTKRSGERWSVRWQKSGRVRMFPFPC